MWAIAVWSLSPVGGEVRSLVGLARSFLGRSLALFAAVVAACSRVAAAAAEAASLASLAAAAFASCSAASPTFFLLQ